MYYEVYIDSVFIMNLMLNLMMLSLTAKIQKCTATHLSLLLGAMFGAVGECILLVLLPLPIWIRLFLAYGIIGAFMVRIGLRIKTRQLWYQSIMMLYLLSFAFGGMMEFLSSQFAYFGIGAETMVGILFAGYVICFTLYFLIGRVRKARKKSTYRVHIYQGEKELEVEALLDTGNGLLEPISGKPVSIIEKEVLKKSGIVWSACDCCVIPFHSIGREHGMMFGFQTDKMSIQNEETTIVCEKAVLGIYEGKISAQNKYQMILHPNLIED